MRHGSVMLVIVACATIPQIAEAHAGNSDPNLSHVCVGNINRIVRDVGPTGACVTAPRVLAETALHWPKALTGGAGDKGPTGDKGSTGDKGPTGDKGLTGDKGPTGDPGGVGAGVEVVAQDGYLSLTSPGTWLVNARLDRMADPSTFGPSTLSCRLIAQDIFGTETVTDVVTAQLDTEDVRVQMGGSTVFRLQGYYRSAVDTVDLTFYVACDEFGTLTPVFSAQMIATRIGTLTIQ